MQLPESLIKTEIFLKRVAFIKRNLSLAVMNMDTLFPEKGKEHKTLNTANTCEMFFDFSH